MAVINVVTDSSAMLSCVISRKQGILSKLMTRECNLFKMSPRTRTLSFILIFLSVNDGRGYSQIPPGMLSITPELCPNLKGPVPFRGNPTPSSASDLLSAAQRLLTGNQRPIINEVTPPVLIESAPGVAILPYQQSPVIIEPQLNLPIANVEEPFDTVSPILSQPEVLPVDPLLTPSQYPYLPDYTSQFEYSSDLNPNFVPFGSMPLEPIAESISLPETLYDNRLAQYPELSQFYSPPINVQIPSMPVISPFVALATPVPALLPQNAPTSLPEFTENINLPIPETKTAIESPVIIPSNLGTSVIESIPTYSPQPFSFQINMPPPSSEQPIILISSSNPTPASPDFSTSPSLPPMMPPPPVIVMERSRSSWKSWLPILLIAMCDGGCGNGCGNCGCGGSNIPIPYPIPIPTNNPIILGRGRTRGNSTITASTTNSTST